MVPPQHHDLAPGPDEDTTLLSRRSLLRRPLLGITAVGAVALLAACGGDDGDSEDEESSDSPSGTDLDNAASTLPPENQQVGEDDEADD